MTIYDQRDQHNRDHLGSREYNIHAPSVQRIRVMMIIDMTKQLNVGHHYLL